ncbi:hypothetical protein ACJMK2_025779 [Sinanodonta woodiana]|uniref:Uncharacterized protein n=1 Tax=Sinanodonta woodiana TaxID=1069815 RepID=A0ABD3XJF5_SINWO
MSIQEDLQIAKIGDVIELVGFSDYGDEGNVINTINDGKQMKSLGNYALQMTNYLYYGFTTAYVNMDGAQSNSSFMHMHGIKLSSTNLNLTSTVNLDQTAVFTMDYSHVIKKIQNNIMKSGIKKINHLAEEVLNDDMLNYRTQYQALLGQSGASLSGLNENMKILHWFKRCEDTIAISDVTSTLKSKKLLSYQCIEDIYACIIDFDQLCRKVISMATYNGPNSHPNAIQYRINLNSIIIGQSSLSRKGNAVTNRANATSYDFNNTQPLRKKTSKSLYLQITDFKTHKTVDILIQPHYCIHTAR